MNIYSKRLIAIVIYVFILLPEFVFSNSYTDDYFPPLRIKIKSSGSETISEYIDKNCWKKCNYNLGINLYIHAKKISEKENQLEFMPYLIKGTVKISGKAEDYYYGQKNIWKFNFDQTIEVEVKTGRMIYDLNSESIRSITMPLTNDPNPDIGSLLFLTYNDNKVYIKFKMKTPWGNELFSINANPNILIRLQIVETDPDKDQIQYVGYKYIISPLISIPTQFSVIKEHEKKIVYLENNTSVGTINDFGDVIYLFDDNNNQLGHIPFDYEFSKNGSSIRDAILIFHNDKNICEHNENKYFPYNNNTQNYKQNWNYYKPGEYPVSMLIPPKNKFPSTFNQNPVLLVHGLAGKYEYLIYKYFKSLINSSSGILAHPSRQDVSYWYTTPRILNEKYKDYHTWQFYYPNNDEILTISKCLNEGLFGLSQLYHQKVNLVTHSYGGPITYYYIISQPLKAKNVIKKVLFCAPPMHGSYAATRAFETILGASSEIFDSVDNEGLCYRDLSLGSDRIWEINQNKLISLDEDKDIYDDYFVLIGTTKSNYVVETLHEEAAKHNDGAVSISSASLLDKGIGFMTIHGNHDDCVHAQSNHPGAENIGDKDLIPDIIYNYFENDYDDFLKNMNSQEQIRSIVKHDAKVYKPSGSTLETLNKDADHSTKTDEIYQKGIINFELKNIPEYLIKSYKKFVLSVDNNTNYSFIHPENYPIKPGNSFISKGIFKKNKYTNRYYYHDEDGIALSSFPDKVTIKIPVFHKFFYLYQAEIKTNFKFCHTSFLTFDLSSVIKNINNCNGQLDAKNGILYDDNENSIKTEFYIDDQTEYVVFLISNNNDDDPLKIHISGPNNTIANIHSNQIAFDIDRNQIAVTNPAAGKWYVWGESGGSPSDEIHYKTKALIHSDIHVSNTNPIVEIPEGGQYTIEAVLNVESTQLLNDIVVKAIIEAPDNTLQRYELTNSKTTIDDGYLFRQTIPIELEGTYLIKLSYEGLYNNFRFERVTYHEVEGIDDTPILSIPDISLNFAKNYKVLDLKNYIHCHDCNISSATFTYNIISSDLKSSAVNFHLDELNSKFFIKVNSFDIGKMTIEFKLHGFHDNPIVDTVNVSICAADLVLENLILDKEIAKINTKITVLSEIKNIGNTCSGKFKLNYYLSTKNLYEKSAILLSSIDITNVPENNSIKESLKISIPNVTTNEPWYILSIIDPENELDEINENNNIGSKKINLLPADIKQYVLVNPSNGNLVFSGNNPQHNGNIKYNNYDVFYLNWAKMCCWALSSGRLPAWVEYNCLNDNMDYLKYIKLMFIARGTTHMGKYYSFLYLNINGINIIDNENELINTESWTVYQINLNTNLFKEGINSIKIGTSDDSKTYVALRGICVEWINETPDENSFAFHTNSKKMMVTNENTVDLFFNHTNKLFLKPDNILLNAKKNNTDTVLSPNFSNIDKNNYAFIKKLKINSTINGRIEKEGEQHCYYIDVFEDGLLTIYTKGFMNTYGILKDEVGNVIIENDNAGGSYLGPLRGNFIIKYKATVGRYYLIVRHYKNLHTGNYQLFIEQSLNK